jgi:hypothetical protein
VSTHTKKMAWQSHDILYLVVAEDACASECCFCHVCVSQLSVALAW